MAKQVTVTLKLRRKTSSGWASTNPVLAIGEMGVVIDTVPMRFKIGDGATAWNNLPYADVAKITIGTTSTLYNLPIDKNIMIVTISYAQGTFTYSATPIEGFQQIIILKNSTASSITQAIPNSGNWKSIDGVSAVIPAFGAIELNVLYVDGIYRVATKV